MMGDEMTVSREEAARRLGLKSAKTLDLWRERGCGPSYVRLGRLVRYRQEDLTNFLHSRLVMPKPAAYEDGQ
jgi:hypothetical protein